MKDRKMSKGEVRNWAGPNVKEIRVEKKITQRELVEKLKELGLDVNACTLSKMENQQRGINDIELAALSRALEVPIERLIGLLG